MAISELQVALLGTGAVAVAAVWGYNAWQERKHKKLAAQIFKGATQADDPLATESPAAAIEPIDAETQDAQLEPGERIEPSFGSGEVEFVADEIPAPQPVTPSVAEVAAEPVPAAPLSHSIPPLPLEYLDPAADCIVRFIAAEPVSAEAIATLQGSFAAELGKPLVWYGWDNYAWQRLDGFSGSALHWVAALQLVDRRGALAAPEFARFRNGLAQVAAQIGADVDLPNDDEVLEQAAQLDQFCAGVDIQLSIHLVEAGGGAFSGTKLRGVAEAAGLVLAEDGVFHYRDADGCEMFTVANIGGEPLNAETIRAQAVVGLSFTLDVPRTARGVQSFDRMLAVAQQLARGLGGVLVDAQRQPLAETMIKTIRAKIGELQKRMEDAGLPPGAALALRLFA